MASSVPKKKARKTARRSKSLAVGRKAAAAPRAEAAPSKDGVADELLAVWDADTWLTLAQLRQRLADGWTLDDAGIRATEAEGYVNKYNSIIVRTAAQPKVVAPSEAAGWVTKKMSWIVDEVFKRAGA